MKAKKHIEKKVEGEYEFQKYHVVDIDLTTKDIDEVWDYLNVDDPEEAYMSYGVAIGFDDCISFIEISKFVNQIDEYFEEEHDMPDWMNGVLGKLMDYMEYTLYPKLKVDLDAQKK